MTCCHERFGQRIGPFFSGKLSAFDRRPFPIHSSTSSVVAEEVLAWIGDGLKSQVLRFPVKNGPIIWPSRSWQQVMSPELLAA